jgi:signal transduction histidine kinase
VIAFVLLILAALVLRRQIEARIGRIRHAARHIDAGNLNSRINISGDDEFARLSIEINRMLDRMEQLVDGVRQVSNAIAHDLRTPLMRVRVRLDDALTCDLGVDDLRDAASAAIDGIDELVLIFNKLLKMAEAESGLRTESLVAIDLSGIVRNMADLYDATAEEQRVRIHVGSQMPIWVNGDRDLLSSAVASLIDNAIKYAGPNRRVEVFAYSAADGAWIVVQDNGPGVPGYELPRLVERFYRVDQSRGQPGNGLGLGIVSAIAKLHGGKLVLANLSPGFRASIMLPTKG